MSISSINSSSAYIQWQMSLQSSRTSPTGGTASASNDGDADDSAQISQQGFAALFQAAGTSGSGMTDQRASAIGARIQAHDPTLFKQLDSNGDGSLSASELKAGHDQIQAARAATIGQQMQQALFAALDAGKDLLSGVDPAQASSAAAGSGQTAGVQHHHHHHHGGGESGGSSAESDPNATANNDPFSLLSSTSSSSSGAANLQTNNLNDVLQQLFASLSNQSGTSAIG